jgi:threonine aldolase
MGVVLWTRNLSDCRTCGKALVLSDERHAWATKVINLENTIRGTVMPLKELQRAPEFTGKHDAKIHLDSARFWETFAASASS